MAEILIIAGVAFSGLLISGPVTLDDLALTIIFMVGATGTVLVRAIKEDRNE